MKRNKRWVLIRRRLLTPRLYAVEPIDDLQAHETFSLNCACQPAFIKETRTHHAQIVHNAFDGRDLIEQYGIQ